MLYEVMGRPFVTGVAHVMVTKLVDTLVTGAVG
jgi:hypothetical protein